MNLLQEQSVDWANWMLHAGWQSTLVALVVFTMLLIVCRRASSQFRYAILLVVLFKFATPPFLSLPTGLLSRAAPPIELKAQQIQVVSTPPMELRSLEPVATTTSAESEAISNPIATMAPALEPSPVPEMPEASSLGFIQALMLLHFLGMLVCAGSVAIRYRRLQRIVQEASPITETSILTVVKEVASRLRMSSLPSLLNSSKTDTPFAIGLLRPTIVLPQVIVDRLAADQLSIVIAHELAHVRRRDLIIGWVQVLIGIVWWFHPAMWWLNRSIRQAREDCCDDLLLTHELADPERYCETLIAAAKEASFMPEPLALGFTEPEHPTARRIRRLMDASLFRTMKVRLPAILLALGMCLVLLPGFGSKPGRAPVVRTDLDGLFGWRNLPFELSPPEESAIAQCVQIKKTYNHHRSGQRVFQQDEARQQLEAILETHPNLFYAQHLLGTWHRLNGNPKAAHHWLSMSLKEAPIVLTRRYELGPATPLNGVKIDSMSIECNRVKNGFLDSNLKLEYVALVTDDVGEVHLPVYDTVYRLSSYTSPGGYRTESDRLGWFEAKSRIGILPKVLAWRPYGRPRDFSRSAAESATLKEASGTSGTRLKSGPNTYVLHQVARAQSLGSFRVSDGKGKDLPAGTAREDLPQLGNTPFMDHAIIDLSSPAPERFDLASVKVLDSQTKIPLESFQSGAGFKRIGKHRFHLYSLWDALPDEVDLVLEVHNYSKGAFCHHIAPKVGEQVQVDEILFQITHLIAGHHTGWDSTGFTGEAEDVNYSSEIGFNMTETDKHKFSLWVVLKDGRKWDLKSSGWHSTRVFALDISAPLDQIDHFELLPYVAAKTFFFEKIKLPARNTPLKRRALVFDFAVKGQESTNSSDLLAPIKLRFSSSRGHLYTGIGVNENSYVFMESPEKQLYPDTKSTITWSTDSLAIFSHETVFMGTEKSAHNTTSGHGPWGAVHTECIEVPLEKITSVRLELKPKEVD